MAELLGSSSVRSGRASFCLRVAGFVLLLVFAAAASASRDISNGTSKEPNPATEKDPHHRSNTSHPKKAFPVLSFNYEYVRTPFEISLWILLALLMKLGERFIFVSFLLLKPLHRHMQNNNHHKLPATKN